MTSRTATAARLTNATRQRRASSSKEGAFAHVYTHSSTESLQVNTWERESGMALAAATHKQERVLGGCELRMLHFELVLVIFPRHVYSFAHWLAILYCTHLRLLPST